MIRGSGHPLSSLSRPSPWGMNTVPIRLGFRRIFRSCFTFFLHTAVQHFDLPFHPSFLGFQPSSDLPPPLAFQLKVNPCLNENHAVSGLDRAILATSHVLPISATYPPFHRDFLNSLILLEARSTFSAGHSGIRCRNATLPPNGRTLSILLIPAKASYLEAQRLMGCNQFRFISSEVDLLQFIPQL
jgi:hypothetical protein